MGGKHSKEEFSFDPRKWNKIGEKNGHDVVSHVETGHEAEKIIAELKKLSYKPIGHDKEITLDPFDIYKLRRDDTSSNNIVKVVAGNIETNGYLCGQSETAHVLTERISTTLHDARPLNEQEANIVLYNSLKGFKKITEIYGVPCSVTDKMIALTPNGETRVWINQNFGDNSIETVTSATNFSSMIEDIVDAIEKKSPGAFSKKYAEDLVTSSTFEEAMTQVEQHSKLPSYTLASNQVQVSGNVSGVSASQKPNPAPVPANITPSKVAAMPEYNFEKVSSVKNMLAYEQPRVSNYAQSTMYAPLAPYNGPIITGTNTPRISFSYRSP